MVLLVCFYDGLLNECGLSPNYVGGKKKLMQVQCGITYDALVEKMYEVMNMGHEECKFTLKYSYTLSNQFFAIDIENNKDVHQMFLANRGCTMIYMYIIKELTNDENKGRENKSMNKKDASSYASPMLATPCDVKRKEPVNDKSIPIHPSRFPSQDSAGSIGDISISSCSSRSQHGMFPCRDSMDDVDSSKGSNSVSNKSHSSGETLNRSPFDTNPMFKGIATERSIDSDGRSSLKSRSKDRKDVPPRDPDRYVQTFDVEDDVPPYEVHGDKYCFGDEKVCNEAGTYRREMTSMQVGKLFALKVNFQNALKEFAILANFQYVPLETRATKVVAKCFMPSCPWRIRASKIHSDTTFKIVSHIPHTCGPAERGKGHRQASSRWVASCIKGLLKLHPDYNIEKIISYIQKQYGVVVSYRKAWRAKEIAMGDITGGWERSYELLPRYCEELMRVDPDAKTELVRGKDNTFLRFFWSFGPSIRSYRRTLRPVVSIDGMCLRGKYGGELLMAQAVDGNNGLFPLAFAVVEKENHQSWEWFLTLLRDHVTGNPFELVIISDRHESIMKCVPLVYPNCKHSYCVYHLAKNFLLKFKNSYVKGLIWKIARELTPQGYKHEMDALEEKFPNYHAWLNDIGDRHWSNAHFPGKRYGILTTNYSECMNSMLLVARTLPITSIVELTHAKVTSYFYQRSLDGEARATKGKKLTKYADAHLKDEIMVDRFLTVSPSSLDEFTVIEKDKTHSVNMETRTCSCRSYDIFGIPCRHAYAAISFRSASVHDFVEEWFTNERYCDTYNDVMHPIVDESQWTSVATHEVVKPPHDRTHSGRPRKVRMKSATEKGNTNKCSTCKKKGHNRRTCTPASPKKKKKMRME